MVACRCGLGVGVANGYANVPDARTFTVKSGRPDRPQKRPRQHEAEQGQERERLHETRFAEGIVPIVADDDVIDYLDLQDTSGFCEGLGRLHICGRRLHFAAGMIVHQHDAVSGSNHGGAEDFPRMCHCLI